MTITQNSTRIRWLISRDMPTVEAIEQQGTRVPWPHRDILALIKQSSIIAMAAEVESDGWLPPLAWMLYELHEQHLELLRLVVAPSQRRCGLGTALISRLQSKLATHRRKSIACSVNEYDTDALLLLRHCGFRVRSIEHDSEEGDWISMVYEIVKG